MQTFTHHTPTEILFGRNTENEVGLLVKKYNGSRVFVVYGGGSVVKSGLLKKIATQLENENIAYTEFGGVQPNPLLSHARNGIKEAIAFGADFILAVGGGSVIDTAKAIAHGTKNPQTDIWQFWLREVALTSTLPVGVVLTISAAGSETSNSAVLTNSETGQKRGLGTEFNRPCFAVMNPELTYTLPKYQIACGIVDILMHTLDRFFTNEEGNELTDELAAALLRVVIKRGETALSNPTDYNSMSEIMWSGSISHNGLTGLGRAVDFSVHQLGHELSAKFDVAHGASLSAMWGSWAKYCVSVNPNRFRLYSKMVWNIDSDDPCIGIEKTVQYFRSIEMPTCISELGIGVQPDDVLKEMADRCVFRGQRLVGTFKPLNKEDAYQIYRLANY